MKKEKKHFHISKSSDDINKVSNQTKSFIINNSHNSQKTLNIFEEKNFNQGIFKSNFLEEMYLKYSLPHVRKTVSPIILKKLIRRKAISRLRSRISSHSWTISTVLTMDTMFISTTIPCRSKTGRWKVLS